MLKKKRNNLLFFSYNFLGGKNMDKIDTISSLSHSITLSERKNIIINGVKKIDSFDEEEFYLETTMGDLIIKGEELEIIKLDTLVLVLLPSVSSFICKSLSLILFLISPIFVL